MENLKRLLVLAAMFLPMSAWAAPFDSGSEKKHINLYYKSEALYIAQEDKACTVGSSTVDDGTCVKTAEIKSMLPVRGAFNNVVSGKWVSETTPHPNINRTCSILRLTLTLVRLLVMMENAQKIMHFCLSPVLPLMDRTTRFRTFAVLIMGPWTSMLDYLGK